MAANLHFIQIIFFVEVHWVIYNIRWKNKRKSVMATLKENIPLLLVHCSYLKWLLIIVFVPSVNYFWDGILFLLTISAMPHNSLLQIINVPTSPPSIKPLWCNWSWSLWVSINLFGQCCASCFWRWHSASDLHRHGSPVWEPQWSLFWKIWLYVFKSKVLSWDG